MRTEVPERLWVPDGTTRVVRRWLFFPTTLRVKATGVKERRWMEYVNVEQRYELHTDGMYFADMKWIDYYFVD